MSEAAPGFHVVLSFGDVYRQSGYRTKVLGELREYEKNGHLQPFLIAFDRDAARVGELDLGDVPFLAHPRSAIARYYRDLSLLAQRAPIRIVHAHNLYSGALALSARRFYGYKVLLELHGRIPEEYVILGKGGAFSHWALNRLEAWVVRGADHIIPISHKLTEYLASEYNRPLSDFTVIPDCADPAAFRRDAAVRETARRALGVEDKFVCVHLGSVSVWYDPELIVAVFERIRRRIPAAHLLVVTEDVQLTRESLAKKLAVGEFTVTAAAHRDVPPLLAASDLGFLLLRTTANIKVASPSKFSEYLNSGLPVLITSEVGDFSSVVAHRGIGAIVSDQGDFDVAFLDELCANREGVATRIADTASELTWDAFRPAWAKIMKTQVPERL